MEITALMSVSRLMTKKADTKMNAAKGRVHFWYIPLRLTTVL